MIPNKTEVLNLKTRKTQVPMGYLSLIFSLLPNKPCKYESSYEVEGKHWTKLCAIVLALLFTFCMI